MRNLNLKKIQNCYIDAQIYNVRSSIFWQGINWKINFQNYYFSEAIIQNLVKKTLHIKSILEKLLESFLLKLLINTIFLPAFRA
jgi:hypothetical protein